MRKGLLKMNKKATVKRYMKEIQRLLPGFHIKRTKLFIDLENEIFSYAQQSDIITYEKLVEQLGQPSELVADYLSSETPETLQRKLRFTRTMRIITCIIIIMAVICFVLYFAWWDQIKKEARESNVYREIIEIREY